MDREAAPAELGDRLDARGPAPNRARVMFSRGRERARAARTCLNVRSTKAADAPPLGRIAAAAFDLGPEGEAAMTSLVGRPNWRVFMRRWEARPAGCGALDVEDDIARLDWCATSPDYRGLDGQSALLRHRITCALDLGCRLLASRAGDEVPNEPQISYRNLIVTGFAAA